MVFMGGGWTGTYCGQRKVALNQRMATTVVWETSIEKWWHEDGIDKTNSNGRVQLNNE
jgi:hypothetical protein